VSDEPRVVVLVTEGCHLCDDAIAVIGPVTEELGVTWESRDLLTQDEATIKQWREYVPVILIDGAVHDVFRVTDGRLRQALSN
jgi:hypothetical protein